MLKFLPKGPRARDESEEAAGPTLGGAFKDYGGQRGDTLGGSVFTQWVGRCESGNEMLCGELQADLGIMTIGIGAMAIGVALGSGGAASAIAIVMTAVRRPMTARRAPMRPIVGVAAPSSCHRNAALAEAEAEDLATATAGGEALMTG